MIFPIPAPVKRTGIFRQAPLRALPDRAGHRSSPAKALAAAHLATMIAGLGDAAVCWGFQAGDSLEPKHDPVMLREILEILPLTPGGVAVDGTLGLAGHSSEFVKRIAPGGSLVATDWDQGMLEIAKARLKETEGVDLHLFHDDFRNLGQHLRALGLKASGVLLDLGLNSAQLDDPARGISFLAEGPLDMRMDRTRGESAAAWLNRATPLEIENALHEYGDERWARAIARVIVEKRRSQPLRTTVDLIECVLQAIPPGARDKRIHPATRTFQAVRIEVNREFEGLLDGIRDIASELSVGGVLAILSYHSGEDRIVKHAFRDLAGAEYEELFRKPVLPSEEEIRRNTRSRSAKLRAIRKIA